MSLIDCPVCGSNLHIKEYKIKGNSIPEGFLFCHSSNPIHFIGTLERRGYDPNKPMELQGYAFFENHIAWGTVSLMEKSEKEKYFIVYKRNNKKDPIKTYKSIVIDASSILGSDFVIEGNISFSDLNEDLFKNYEIMG